jgi:zinc/manganese transport system substrate-binding protein
MRMMTHDMILGRRAMMVGAGLTPVLATAAAPLPVVASFSILGDIVRQIGGDAVAVSSLVPADADAHAYQPATAELRAVNKAALLVENGLGLEGWMARLGGASGFHGTRVVATKGVAPRYMKEGAHTSLDPHAWQDPRNGAIYAANIADGLVAAAGDQAAVWRAGADRFRAAILDTDRWIEQQIAAIPRERRRIIATHDAFGYYGARYGITFLAVEGLSTDDEPSAKAVAALVAQIKREKATTVFLENMTDPRLATMLAREAGVTVSGPLYSDALSKPDGPAADYVTMLRYNTGLFVRAMKGV